MTDDQDTDACPVCGIPWDALPAGHWLVTPLNGSSQTCEIQAPPDPGIIDRWLREASARAEPSDGHERGKDFAGEPCLCGGELDDGKPDDQYGTVWACKKCGQTYADEQ